MKNLKKTPQLELSPTEREALRKNKIRIHNIADLDIAHLSLAIIRWNN